MGKGKSTKFKAGDLVKLTRPKKKKDPKRIGSEELPGYFPANFEGSSGRIYYDRIYEVSGKSEIIICDNNASPIPLISKEFINHPVFNEHFTAVKNQSNEEES